jgi:hypothetical protein
MLRRFRAGIFARIIFAAGMLCRTTKIGDSRCRLDMIRQAMLLEILNSK